MLNRYCTALFIIALLCSGAVQSRSHEDVVKSGYIEFAVYRDFPPYSFLRAGQPAGVDIDLGSAIAKSMGLEVRWLWLTADESVEDDLRNAIWKGSLIDRRVADVMLRVPYDRAFSYGRDGYNLPRNEMVVMLAPYHTESWQLARDLEKTGTARSLAIFQYQPIGVELDSLPDFYLVGAFGGRLRNNVHHYSSLLLAIDDLKDGKLSAVAGMRGQLEWGLGAERERFDIDDDGLEALGKKTWDLGVAVRENYRQLGHAVEEVIAKLVVDGSLEKIYSGYGLSYQMPEYFQVSPQIESQVDANPDPAEQ